MAFVLSRSEHARKAESHTHFPWWQSPFWSGSSCPFPLTATETDPLCIEITWFLSIKIYSFNLLFHFTILGPTFYLITGLPRLKGQALDSRHTWVKDTTSFSKEGLNEQWELLFCNLGGKTLGQSGKISTLGSFIRRLDPRQSWKLCFYLIQALHKWSDYTVSCNPFQFFFFPNTICKLMQCYPAWKIGSLAMVAVQLR